jgi:hypothetical protein
LCSHLENEYVELPIDLSTTPKLLASSIDPEENQGKARGIPNPIDPNILVNPIQQA